MKWAPCRQHIVKIFNHSVNLLICIFIPFISNVVIDILCSAFLFSEDFVFILFFSVFISLPFCGLLEHFFWILLLFSYNVFEGISLHSLKNTCLCRYYIIFAKHHSLPVSSFYPARMNYRNFTSFYILLSSLIYNIIGLNPSFTYISVIIFASTNTF